MQTDADPEGPDVIYGHMRWNAPLSEEHAARLLDLLLGESARTVLDLGCGWGELLLRAVAQLPEGRAVGIDNADWALARARRTAAERGLASRTDFAFGDCAKWTDAADAVVCVGASHAWDSSRAALGALARNVRPGGHLLFGDGFWQSAPTRALKLLFGDGVLTLDGLVAAARAAGWEVASVSEANQDEWDEFEWSWLAGREQWIRDHPSDLRLSETEAEVDRLRRRYHDGYRGILGFAFLVLR